jgi:cytochrome c peroxidase
MKRRSTNFSPSSRVGSLRAGRWAVMAGALAYALALGTGVLRAQVQDLQHQQQVIEPLIRGPQSLKGVRPPEPPNLGDFVVDRQAAITLGKALFWDMNAGSDETQACASCHFNAGADTRIKNQVNPGQRSTGPNGSVFDPTASGNIGGPNYTLRADDFPFHRLADPTNRDSALLFSSDDIAGSQGVFQSTFNYTMAGAEGTTPGDGLFHVGTAPNDVNTRQTTPRNAPTVINAAFNFRNFWDGRASNEFNGRSPFGRRDLDARIWVTDAAGNVSAVQIALKDASAASQAVGPVLNDVEMSGAGRSFADLGRKLIGIRALNRQLVDPTDSVLGTHVYLNASGVQGNGLKETYKTLIQKAFLPKYWNAKQATFYMTAGSSNSQMEENFSLFWGLSIMMYESTLVSDDTRFDRYMAGDLSALTAQENRGLALFLGPANCAACHRGPELTSAGTYLQFEEQTGGLVERMFMGDPFALSPAGVPQGPIALYDQGFYNLGVTPAENDIGIGGTDPFGNPLSFARGFVRSLTGPMPADAFFINPCTFEAIPCVPVTESGPRVAVDGSFKVPTLRNVELTGPYFHNGGYATLDSVVEFYNRGGNRRWLSTGGDTTGLAGGNDSNLDQDIFPLMLGKPDRDAIVAFLKALTDERVRWEMAPFDHPSLKVAHGSAGDEYSTTMNSDGTAKDSFIAIPAVGASGRAAKGLGPIQPFTPKS